MKSIFYSLILMLAVVCHAAFYDEFSGPARNTAITEKYLLPGWVDIDDNGSGAATKGASVGHFVSEGSTEIELSPEFYIHYMGKTYKSLSVYGDFRIALGKYSYDLDNRLNPFVQPIKPVFRYTAGTFKWNCYKAKLARGEVNYTAIEFGEFSYNGHPYSLQVLFYVDGEIHVQLWQTQNSREAPPYVSREDWTKASVFNGYTTQSLEENYPKEMPIFANGQIREGWIAKGFGWDVIDGVPTITSSSSISGVRSNAGQIEFKMGSNEFAGALFAYDDSREHPVIGSINKIDVNVDYSSVDPSAGPEVYFWYFNEKTNVTHEAGYPYLNKVNGSVYYNYRRLCADYYSDNKGTSGNASYTLNQIYYSDVWKSLNNADDCPSNNRYTDVVRFRPAPAFKFQKHSSSDVTLSFNSIIYKLEQRPTTCFRPPSKDYVFTTSSNEGGRIVVTNLDGQNPYEVYKGQEINAEIRASVGSEIKTVKVNGITLYSNGVKTQASVLGANADLLKYLQPGPGHDEDQMMVFNAIAEMNMDLEVEFGDCSGRKLPLVTPEMLKTTKFLDPENLANARKSSSAVIKGSFGENVQKQDSLIAVDETTGLPVRGNYIVSAYYTDDYGQKNYSPSDFVHEASKFEYLDMACYKCVVKANAYYDGTDDFDKPDAKGVAYIRHDKRYGDKGGSNGTSYGIADASEENYPEQAESWTIPVFSESEFIPKEELSTKGIQPYYGTKHAKGGIAKYSLTVERDNEGHYNQKITNTKGQTVSTWRQLGDKVYFTKYEYDSFDRLISVYPADNEGLAVKYRYNDKGQVIETEDPDRGVTRTAYDKYGRVRFIQNDAQKARNRFSAKIYDDRGREIASVEVVKGHDFSKPDVDLNAANYIPYNRTMYGMPTLDSLTKYGLNADAALVSAILGNMHNIREKDVGATFAYDADGSLVVAKMASYDRIGRKTRQWVIYTMATMPAVELTYEYNQSDELTHSSFGEWNGTGFVTRAQRYRSYDAAGRLLKIEDENHKNIATYEYTKNGNVKGKSYYDKGVLVYKKTIIRDVYGRPKKILYENGSKLLYKDTIGYVSPLAGRISEAEHTWKDVPNHGDEVRGVSYEYDTDARLTKVDGTLSGEYAYNGPYGQMTHKKEGDTIVNYTYFDRNKYRPSGFDVNGTSLSGTTEYLLYDAAGNVWLDRHANVAYRLNSAGLPEAAYVLAAGAAEPTLDQVNAGSVANVNSTMYMAYDEGGQRIWTAFHGAGVDEEFATMPGIGKYYAQHVSNDVGFTMTQMDLVAGGFRDVNSGIAYYPVTDMQGNVRAYASTGGLEGAIDYYAYGTADEIVHGNVEDNKRWQGKEEDGPIRKLYFGSRYFDPFFGMWLTPDPAGQFANPYTYGGDPVNYVDPNGEWVHIVIGAVVGAVMGTVNAVVQCTAPGGGGGNCAKSVLIQSNIGAAVGAAAAATGGAVGGGLVGGIVGGAVGGAGNYAGNYASYKALGMDAEWDWGKMGIEALKGGISGAAGYGGGQLFNGMRGALAGGFASGVAGSAMNGDKGWDILKGGIMSAAMGAAMGGIAYAADVHVDAKADYQANEMARQNMANEMGQSLEGLDDLYQKQLTETSKYGEYQLIDGQTEASKMPTEQIKEGVYRNKMGVGKNVGTHAHGPMQDYIGAKSGPSGPDLIAAAVIQQQNPDYKSFVMDVTTNKIHQYNGDGINVANVDFSNKQEYNKLLMQANYHVNQRLNVVQTIDYVPKVTYKTYYNSRFSW